jgi:hypothetical protein
MKTAIWWIRRDLRLSDKENSNMLTYKRTPGTANQGALDFSWLQDAPAGKHGFLKTTPDGHFEFEDGTRLRFMGVNLVVSGALCEHEVAQAIAEDLFHSGVNLVRFHHVDSREKTSLLDCRKGNSLEVSEDNFDKLDYLVSLLKARGIYFHIDLHTLRTYFPDDGLPPEEAEQLSAPVKSVHHYDRRIIELHKRWIKQYLTHYNPYTQMRYVDDPAVAIVQYVNENGIFWDQTEETPTLFYKQLDERFNRWLLDKYGSRQGLEAAWTREDGKKALSAQEDPTQGTVIRPPLGIWGERTITWKQPYASLEGPARFADHMEFLAEIERSTYQEIQTYLRQLGVRCVINLSNLPCGPAELRCTSDADVTEHNNYWNHPVGGFRLPVTFHNEEMCAIDPRRLGSGFAMHSPAALSRGVVHNKPFVVTEWNCIPVTRFRVDALLQMACYGALQDWDGILLFTYTGLGTKRLFEDHGIYGFFDSCADPAIWGYFGIAAAIFRLGLVDVARNTIDICYSPEDWKVSTPDYGILHHNTMFISKVAAYFLDGAYHGQADIALASGNTASGDYTTARHAIVHSDNPYSDSHQQVRGRPDWLDGHTNLEARVIKVANMDARLGEQSLVVYTPDGTGALAHIGHEVIQTAMTYWKLLGPGQGWGENQVTSDTSQITYAFGQGAFMVNAPRVSIFAGKTTSGDAVGSCTLHIENDKAGVAVLSLDGAPIGDSHHLLVNAMGICHNSGMRFVGNALVDNGGAPILYDDMRGTLDIPSRARSCTAWGLETDGNRRHEVSVTSIAGGFAIALGGYAHYEVILA